MTPTTIGKEASHEDTLRLLYSLIRERSEVYDKEGESDLWKQIGAEIDQVHEIRERTK